MTRFLTFLWVVFLYSAAPLQALPEEDDRKTGGEIEETTDILPEVIIPWHDSLLELPGWISQEAREIQHRRRPANHGAGLFPPEVWPLQPEPVLGPLIPDHAPRGIFPQRGSESPVTAVALGPEVMALYTSQLPDRVLVNPQNLVPVDRVEPLVQRWLNEQCVFRTTVLLFGAGQQLPAGFDPQALRTGWFGGDGDELLVFYFHQEPQRTLAIFGPEARNRYGADLLRSVVDAAVTEAGRVNGGQEQLERFCYKMSVRLHWLARTAPAVATRRSAPEIGRPVDGSMRKAALAALAGAGLIAVGRLVLTWYRRRRLHPAFPAQPVPVFLPENEFRPRFGAPHSGGFSAVITFAKQPAAAAGAP